MSATLIVIGSLAGAGLLVFLILLLKAVIAQQRRYLTWYRVERSGEEQLDLTTEPVPTDSGKNNAA